MEWIASGLAALTSGLLTYFVARHKASGNVEVTDADRLWEEAKEHRRQLNARIYELEIDILRLRRENHELRNELTRSQLLATPGIPEEVKERILAQQDQHLRDLNDALDRKRAHRPWKVDGE